MTDRIRPINRLTLPRWALSTALASVLTYRPVPRPVTRRRLEGLRHPNLEAPVFLVGAPRSGTTFLGECLGVLPEISYHFEPVVTKAAARYVYEQRWSFEQARRFYRAVYGWLMRLHGDGDLRFAEKTPRNAFIVPFLSRAFPRARFIHIIRDGRDVAVSWSGQRWLQAAEAGSGRREPGGYRYGPYPRFWVEPDRAAAFRTTSDLHRCIWGWRRFTAAAMEGAAHLPAGRCCQLRYEDLARDPRRAARGVLDFLEIDRADSRRRLETAAARARPGSIGRWRRRCTAEDLAMIDAEAGPLLEALGYHRGEPGR